MRAESVQDSVVLKANKRREPDIRAPNAGLAEGIRVRIKAGPLQGVEGWVEQRYGPATVLLRLDFINQAAAVKIDADLLELI